METAIEARGLSKRFGTFTAVDELDLTIRAGRIYGFLGPNGSGKSTTIRMLCGLLLPSEGQVQVLGLQVPESAERVKRHLGYMTQRFSLYGDLSVEENLRFLAQVHGIPRREIPDRIETALSTYWLADKRHQFAGTMSGGQQQRLALAGVTLHRPRLLILDEPTSAVDPQSRRDFWDILFDLAASGTTILVSTHLMDEAERCDRLAILDRGRLVAEGEPRELMASLPAQVLEVETEELPTARQAIESLPGVLSVAQLGRRLHVLVEPDHPHAAHALRTRLEQPGITARVTAVDANLEDVFVSATTLAED